MKGLKAGLFFGMVLALTLAWTSARAQPYEARRSTGVHPVRVLLLVPERFDRYVYSSLHRGSEVWHRFGEEAVDRMRMVLGPEFERFEIRSIRHDPDFNRMFNPDEPEYLDTSGFDFVAVPSFGEVRSWSRGREYGVEINVALEFRSTDGIRISNVKGYAETSTGSFYGITPREAGSTAMAAAVGALRNRIASSPELFRP
jgi:hypothetical protein